MTRRSSVALAHLHHPDRSGETLCGAEPTRVVGCPDCASRRDVLLRVHVQSPRKPDRSFCGMPIRVPRGAGGDPPLAYVSAVVAARLAGGEHGIVPICRGCLENLARYDVAAARRRSSAPAAIAARSGSVTPGAVPAEVGLASGASPTIEQEIEDDVA